MKQKKQSADWYIAATHYLTAGFVLPLIIGLIAGFIIVFLGILEGALTYNIIIFVVFVLSIWLGIIYSSGYINKTYIIKDVSAISRLSTIYFVLIFLIRIVIFRDDMLVVVFNVVELILGAVLFYSLTNKYIKKSDVIESQPGGYNVSI